MSCGKCVNWLVVFSLLGSLLNCSVAADLLEEKMIPPEKIEQIEEEAERQKAREAFRKEQEKLKEKIAEIDLPVDTSIRMTVREVQISGNTLITTQEIMDKMPLIFNVSDKPLTQAPSDMLYDFRILKEIMLEPGRPREVSSTTIRAFVRYILSVYRKKNYAGIYVYVPVDTVIDKRRLRNEILQVNVLEAQVTGVTIRTYDPNQQETEKGYLRKSLVEEWSPVETGKVANQKKLDEFVNLLNLNPDRYVSATVTQGVEPQTLALEYDIYEANPWHWFIQVDNSGTDERQWNPRVGLINTNMFGFDDSFTAIYQAPWDSTYDENYSLFGSYDIPLFCPHLRLNFYGGYSEFDVTPEAGPFGFLGAGTFYGGILKYNILQHKDWFLDIKGSMEFTESKVSPDFDPFVDFLASEVDFWLAGWGMDLYRSGDMSNTKISLNWYESISSNSDSSEFNTARANSESDFAIYNAYATHSRFLDENKVNRVSGNVRWVGASERLVPTKMTAFGGMYTVRGYDEYEYVADGGILASAQYELDLVKLEQAKQKEMEMEEEQPEGKLALTKLAPLLFFDYGRGKIRHPVGTERAHEELMSAGTGLIVQLGENLTGTVYYGHALSSTDDTKEGNGRVHAGFMLRW